MPLNGLGVRYQLDDPMLGELGFNEVDNLARRHRIQLDAAISQERNFVFSRTMSAQRYCTLVPVSLHHDRLRLQAHCLHIVEPQADVDERHDALKLISSVAGPQGAEDAEAADIKVMHRKDPSDISGLT